MRILNNINKCSYIETVVYFLLGLLGQLVSLAVTRSLRSTLRRPGYAMLQSALITQQFIKKLYSIFKQLYKSLLFLLVVNADCIFDNKTKYVFHANY